MLYDVLTDLAADLETVDVIRHKMNSTVDPAHACFLGGRREAGEKARGEVLRRIAGIGEREVIPVDRGEDGRGGTEGALSRYRRCVAKALLTAGRCVRTRSGAG